MNIVEKIHAEFDSAQDVILKEARELIQLSKIDDPEKLKLMKDLGFVNVQSVVEADEKRKLHVSSIEMAEKVNYYKMTYPFLKFLTEEKLNEICDKYDLVYAPVQNYTKEVPEKNLKEIANAQSLNPSDKKSKIWKFDVVSTPHDQSREIIQWLKEQEFNFNPVNISTDILEEMCPYENTTGYSIFWPHKSSAICINFEGLFIAAPKSHFKDLQNLNKKGKRGFLSFVKVKPEPKDPIVFRYVKGGIQVLSKWGDEAEDIELQNGILN